jgi:peptidoglycan hydrolase-like protein with peptidoglycan-binding domain
MHRSVYGIVALGLLAAVSAAQAGLAQTNSSQIAIRQAQSELKREGLYDGAIDGIAGLKTKRGIIAFQQREGLQPTARFDDATRVRIVHNALRMDSAWSEPERSIAEQRER